MTTNEVDQEADIKETKSTERQAPPLFIPKLRGKKVIIRLISGGQPVTGTLEGYIPGL